MTGVNCEKIRNSTVLKVLKIVGQNETRKEQVYMLCPVSQSVAATAVKSRRDTVESMCVVVVYQVALKS